jgi:ubiquinone/menaquinone biosynthesis C-methylase UbiE
VSHPQFDALAPHYAWLETLTFGPALQDCRTAWVSRVCDTRNVLILGEGNGRFLEDFLARNRQAAVDVVDASPGMNRIARQRVHDSRHRVTWHTADILEYAYPPGRYDLLVTNFVLDCFPEETLRTLIPQLARSLQPGGYWIVGDFRIPDHPLRGPLARLLTKGMYAFFRVTTRIPADRLANPDPHLLAQGLQRTHTRTLLGGWLQADLWELPGTPSDPGSAECE